MNYISADYHKKYSYMMVKNEDGRVEGRGTVNNTKAEVQHFLELYCPGMAVVAATRNWGLIYDWLDEVLDGVAPAQDREQMAEVGSYLKERRQRFGAIPNFALTTGLCASRACLFPHKILSVFSFSQRYPYLFFFSNLTSVAFSPLELRLILNSTPCPSFNESKGTF